MILICLSFFFFAGILSKSFSPIYVFDPIFFFSGSLFFDFKDSYAILINTLFMSIYLCFFQPTTDNFEIVLIVMLVAEFTSMLTENFT